MGWDVRRPVPWRRMSIEWAVVAAAMVVVTQVISDSPIGETISAIVLGLVVYLAVGYITAKLGYQRASLRQLRAQAQTQQTAARAAAPRPRPAPTRRTNGPTRRRR